MEKKRSSRCKVCVTGGAGYIASSLIKKLMDSGYIVHTTLRNLNDQSKVGLLKSFPHSDTRLFLFEADMYKPEEFEKAIRGCEIVFHVATPLYHSEGFEYKNRVEATVAATRSIARCCVEAGTVRRLIYTASVVAASPLKEDGNGYKDFMDETCCTPLHLSVPYSNDFVKEYTEAKTLAEKEILSFGNTGGLEVVTLGCGLVGGDTYLSYTPASVVAIISQLIGNDDAYNSLKCLEELLGKIPIVHIEDVCDAHIFCMEAPSTKGRFLCTSSYVSSAEIASYYQNNYPEFHLNEKYFKGTERKIELHSTKLIEAGFEYKYDTKRILDDCISYAKRKGDVGLQ